MKTIPEASARHLTQKSGARMVLVISLEEGAYGITTYGRRDSERVAAKRLGAEIGEQFEDGTLATFAPPVDGTSPRSVDQQVQRLTELLAQAVGGHGGDSCPLGYGNTCVRCRVAREATSILHPQTERKEKARKKKTVAVPPPVVPTGPCTEDGCEEVAATNGLCLKHFMSYRAQAGLGNRDRSKD